MSHTSAPWNPYRTFAHLVEQSGGHGIRLSGEDYDYAAKCVNAHDALVEALAEAARVIERLGQEGTWQAPTTLAACHAALNLAKGTP